MSIKSKSSLDLRGYRLSKSRIRFCFAFVAKRNGRCDGYRHFLLIILACAAMPLYGTAETRTLLEQLSNKFCDLSGVPHPTDSMDIEAILNRLNRKGIYKISNARICSWLKISKQEYNILALSNKKSEKRDLKKLNTKKKKEERDQIIIKAINKGATYRHAADLAGCSIRTVASVVAKNKSLDYQTDEKNFD